MPIEIDGSNQLHMLLGELIANGKSTDSTLRQVNTTLEELRKEVAQNSRSYTVLEEALRHTNSDIRLLRESVVTAGELRKAGVNLDDAELVKDFAHMRQSRLAAEDRKPIVTSTKTQIISLIVTAIFVWLVARLTAPAPGQLAAPTQPAAEAKPHG